MPVLFTGALPFFTKHQLRIPEDVSTVVLDGDSSLAWCDPVPTHLNTNPTQWVKKVMRWVHNVARGREDRSKTIDNAVLVEGETIWPVPTAPSTAE